MKFQRHFSRGGKQLRFSKRKVRPFGQEREVTIEAPIGWSDGAVEVAVRKYLRKSLLPHHRGREKSLKAVFHRMAYAWMKAGQKMGLLTSGTQAQIFYDEIFFLLYSQRMAPNSPQWFNTGLNEVYDIEGAPSGHYALDWKSGKVRPCSSAYERPQTHACFIQSVRDTLVGKNGLMDLLTKEARLFKYGSGSGTNFSSISEKGASLESGGKSSGVISFLKVSDRSAGSIKSGGTTRRAAKMVILDSTHPDVLDFIRWKAQQESYVQALMIGSIHLKALEQWSQEVSSGEISLEQFLNRGRELLIPQVLLKKVVDLVSHGETYKAPMIRAHYEGEAYEQASGQNANHSLRIPDKFFRALKTDGWWTLTSPQSGKTHSRIKAQFLWQEVLEASWTSADPGLIFQDTVQRWHKCPVDGAILASNPCGEYLFLDETACNLASLNLLAFIDHESKQLQFEDFKQAVKLTITMLDITVSLAAYPSEEIAQKSLEYRTLGIGLTNMGAALMSLGIPYASDQGRGVLASVVSTMSALSWQVSAQLAQKLGKFPAYNRNKKEFLKVISRHQKAALKLDKEGLGLCKTHQLWKEAKISLESFGARNAQVSLLAPTGTISLTLDCDTTGIEPEFSLMRKKIFSGGGESTYINQQFINLLSHWKNDERERELILKELKQKGHLTDCIHLSLEQKNIIKTSREILPQDHLKMVAAVQPFLCGGVSKTINLLPDISVKDLDELYLMAHDLGLKSIAIYREGSKLSEPLIVDQDEPRSEESCPSCLSHLYCVIGRCRFCFNCGFGQACS